MEDKRRNENELTEDEQRTQDEILRASMMIAPPTPQDVIDPVLLEMNLPRPPQDQRQYNNIVYGHDGQQRYQNQGGFLNQNWGTGPPPPLPPGYRQGYPSMTSGLPEPGRL